MAVLCFTITNGTTDGLEGNRFAAGRWSFVWFVPLAPYKARLSVGSHRLPIFEFCAKSVHTIHAGLMEINIGVNIHRTHTNIPYACI